MEIIIIPDQSKEECGIYGNIVTKKGAPNIMKTAQESIQDRFCLEEVSQEEENYEGKED